MAHEPLSPVHGGTPVVRLIHWSVRIIAYGFGRRTMERRRRFAAAPCERVTLIAAGAGAGIAATFNTPIGGVLFAVEIMLHEVSARTLVPVTIATATASYVGRLFFGSHPSFVIPASEMPYFHHTDPFVLIFYVGLGLLTGLVSVVYIRSIYAFEDFFDRRVRGSYYLRHMLGMLSVGVIMYAVLRFTGHYHIQGVGYATVQDVLSGEVNCVRVRQDLSIAESQLRDYQARLGKPFLHDVYLSELTSLRDQLKAGLSATAQMQGD